MKTIRLHAFDICCDPNCRFGRHSNIAWQFIYLLAIPLAFDAKIPAITYLQLISCKGRELELLPPLEEINDDKNALRIHL